MEKVKLVICDIDNTLVKKGEPMSMKTKEVLAKLRAKGVYFGIASGRPLYQIEGSMRNWGYDGVDVIIGFNGSSLHDRIKHEDHDYYIMKKEWLKEVVELMAKFNCNPTLYRDNAQLFLYEEPYMKDYYAKSGFTYKIVNDINELISQDAAKIMFRVKAEDMPEIEKWVNAHPSENYLGVKTQSIMMEFCDKRINKAYALKKFCEIHDIKLSEVVAFGDTSNDNEMLQAAGLGVCLKNGSEDTKAIADAITEFNCDEDGLALYLEKYILPTLDQEA